jgi:hypothetical protein
MSYSEYFLELIGQLLEGKATREDVATRIAREVPIDKDYGEDQALLENCEWALRHANEPGYYTTIGEFKYYLACLKGEEDFSVEERNRRIKKE